MVKFIAPSLTIVFLTLAAVKAQSPIVIANFPPPNAIPPTNSTEVQAWIKELGDLSGAPNIPLRSGAPPECANPPAEDECNWTCQQCPADDITACSAPNTWGLTFDDGPSTATPTLLDYLKTNKLSATFFVIGSNVINNPDTVKREITEGHHLASHTWSHNALTTLTNEQIVAEMKWTEKAVMDATGLRMKYMRPPYGDINNRVRFVLKKMGYIPVDWTGDAFDTNDWKMPGVTEDQAVTRFTKSLDDYVASDKAKGFYCLEHDLNAGTVALAQKLIPLGLTRKINIASVAQCEKDAEPYQAGSTAPMPTVSGVPPPSKTSGPGGNSTDSPTSGAITAAPNAAGLMSVAVAAMAVAGAALV
ncbi:chitin deacetylase [Mortierella polycephala]|uniref:Chitin deacetylase n=1 Tax=Mortierella polycephala TaxID=41804 RepID=A0A9P6U814_9FUNG|nr:chitin deacetylase [Mortierella polycephala]